MLLGHIGAVLVPGSRGVLPKATWVLALGAFSGGLLAAVFLGAGDQGWASSEDLALILSGFSEVREGRATLKVLVRPLVAWIWLGGAVMTLGTLVALWLFRPRAQREQ